MPPTRREALKSVAAFAAAAALPLTTRGQETPKDAAKSSPATPKQRMMAASAAEPVCLTDFEPLAKAKMSHMAWEYVNSAAADEITVKWNREAFARIRLKPRVLIDVSKLDTRVTLFGQEMPFPILLAPTSSHRITHPEGEIATAHGASAARATMVLSTLSTTSVEDVAAALKTPLWFQLYVQQDRGFTRELVQRAPAAGCRALCLTVDTPVTGARNREERAHFALPPGVDFPHLRGLKAATSAPAQDTTGVASIFSSLLSPDLTWKDVAWLQSFAKVPLLLKGVLNPDDADRAAKEGVAGIIVSNHGGRNFDTVPATIDALPLVAEKVAGRIPILMDGGVRRGTDVLKALALGASAVQIGRPYVYGLGAAGAEGVARVLHILQSEFMMAMALAGRPRIVDIDRTVFWPS
jgi:4-hydroxymandelate oxidase